MGEAARGFAEARAARRSDRRSVILLLRYCFTARIS